MALGWWFGPELVVLPSATSGYASNNAYTNWAAGQPDNSGDQDYVIFNHSTGTWSDSGSEAHSLFIQWDADAVLDATHALTYSIQSQTIAGTFAIDADSGTITIADGLLLDYETDAIHTITVRVSDGTSTYDESFTVSLDDLTESNFAPTSLSSGIELNSDGGNDVYLSVFDPTLFNGLNELTFEIAFSGLDMVGTQATIYSHSQPGVSSSSFSILADGALHLNGLSSVGKYIQLLDGGLHRLAFNWDAAGGVIQFFVDGNHAETIAAPPFPAFTSGGTLLLGQHVDHGDGSFDPLETFAGTVHDVRIWNELRDETEIARNYQNKFASGNLPSGLIANWQMDGFNGTNQVVDIVSGNNLSIGHATGTGFISSMPVKDLHIIENAAGGTTVGYVVPSDPDVINNVLSDGRFTEASDPATFAQYNADGGNSGSAIGYWTVESGVVFLHNAKVYIKMRRRRVGMRFTFELATMMCYLNRSAPRRANNIMSCLRHQDFGTPAV